MPNLSVSLAFLSDETIDVIEISNGRLFCPRI